MMKALLERPAAQELETLTLMLVDDHPLLREGLRAILAEEPDLELVAEAASGSEALSFLERVSPSPRVLLLDVRMPEMDGMAVLRELAARHPEIAVIILTMYMSENSMIEALGSGARGYVLKEQACELIPLAVRTVAAGGVVLPPGLAREVLGGAVVRRPAGQVPPDCVLSPREVSIVRLIAQGYSNRSIAEELHLAEATIKKYVQSLTGKLGASDRGHAAVTAMRMGIVE